MSKIVTLHPTEPVIDPEMVTIAEHLLMRVKAGVTIGLGIVEHQLGDVVSIELRGGGSYHHLNSGSTRLSHLINAMGWEKEISE